MDYSSTLHVSMRTVHLFRCAVSHPVPTRTLAKASNKCWVQIDRKAAAGLSPPPPGPLAPKEGKQKVEREEEQDSLLPSVPEIVKSVEEVIENAVRISLSVA